MGEATMSWPVTTEAATQVQGCGKCGAIDSTLTVSVFTYAASAVFFTVRRVGSSGVFCARCRRKEAIKWSLLTSVLGWWGVPWGPIFTVQSLVRNARGGRQDKNLNAELLKGTGETLASRGESSEAIRALELSAGLRPDVEVDQLLGQLRGY
jgi:hypothetical protein